MNIKAYQTICEMCAAHNSKLIIVSKYRKEEEIMQYYQKGHRDFAENRVQEMCFKKEHLPQDIRWHMIGHLQSNKVKYIVPFITMIHSVHSLSLLQEIEKQACKINRTIPICLQFNLAKEDSKSGFAAEEWHTVLKQAKMLAHISIQGIMVIGPHTDDKEKIYEIFQEAACLQQQMQQVIPSCTQLSMGMSNDYPIALSCGATMIRIGSLLFHS